MACAVELASRTLLVLAEAEEPVNGDAEAGPVRDFRELFALLLGDGGESGTTSLPAPVPPAVGAAAARGLLDLSRGSAARLRTTALRSWLGQLKPTPGPCVDEPSDHRERLAPLASAVRVILDNLSPATT